MKEIIFTGEIKDLKGFFKDSTLTKDPFFTGTHYKALGNSKFLYIREGGQVRLMCGDLIYNNVEDIKNILTKMNLEFKEVGEDKNEED